MSEFDQPGTDSFPIYEEISESARMSMQRSSTRQSLHEKFERECQVRGRNNEKESNSSQLTRSGGSWCDGFTMPSVNPRQALRSGAEKISQTLNTVRTTFGTLSQKLRKSTRRRQPLKNVDSPKTPVTPYTRSRTILGRTPTKLYSPFSIDTPGKENNSGSPRIRKISPMKVNSVAVKKKVRAQKNDLKGRENAALFYSPGMKLASDLEQTQIGIYEFQSTANRIVRRSLRN